jgi:putative FmdB family regulatory protein
MPTYEYVCAKCQHHFEKYQPIIDQALTICPKELCPRKTWGKGKVIRAVVRGGGLIFKGSGFYTTDYRSEGYKAAAKKDAASNSAASTDSAKKDAASSTSGSTDSAKKDATSNTSGSTDSAKKESKPAQSAKPKADGSTPAKSR